MKTTSQAFILGSAKIRWRFFAFTECSDLQKGFPLRKTCYEEERRNEDFFAAAVCLLPAATSRAFALLSNPSLLLWSWRRDLNPRPSDYKSDALPTELRQQKHLIQGSVDKRLHPRTAFARFSAHFVLTLNVIYAPIKHNSA
jgi:hypothetical protein